MNAQAMAQDIGPKVAQPTFYGPEELAPSMEQSYHAACERIGELNVELARQHVVREAAEAALRVLQQPQCVPDSGVGDCEQAFRPHG